MTNYTVSYILKKDGIQRVFDSEKSACKYLGVRNCSVASCYRRGAKCKGYEIERGEITTHNATKTRLFKIWEGMHERCYRPKHMHYKNYGGRGISICKEWHEFTAFRDWALSNGYKEDLTIDRINTNGNYEPSNCRWATIQQQARNKRTNHMVWVGGVMMTLSECSMGYGIPKSTLRWREAHGRNILTGAKMDEVSE